MRFVTQTESQLLAALTAVEKEIAKGSRLISAGSGDVNTTRQNVNSLETTWRRLYLGLNALNPDAYPIQDGDIPVERTRVTFGNFSYPWLQNM